MTRYAIAVEYAGTAYCGWQRQPHCTSIQQLLEDALGFVADHRVDLVCAGRTDTGVHAIEQIAHFDSDAERDDRAWLMGANCRLPRDIRIQRVTPVADAFHARFSAVSRTYRYVILNAPVASAVFHARCCWEFRPLDHRAMHDCAQVMLGEHDFSSFRAVGCQSKSSRRNLHAIEVSRRGEQIYIDIRANAFLYHMVRNIAGSLMAVGRGERDADWFNAVFAARDRNQAEATAPASGLYLVQIGYDPHFKLVSRAKNPVLF